MAFSTGNGRDRLYLTNNANVEFSGTVKLVPGTNFVQANTCCGYQQSATAGGPFWTFSGVISDFDSTHPSTLQRDGNGQNGTFVFTGLNSFSGGFNQNNGNTGFAQGTDPVTGYSSMGTGRLTLNGYWVYNASNAPISFNNPVTIAAGDQGIGLTAQPMTFTGPVTLNNGTTHLYDQLGNVTFTGAIGNPTGDNGTKNVEIFSSTTGGSYTFAGANTYTGTTVVDQGNLYIGAIARKPEHRQSPGYFEHPGRPGWIQYQLGR